MAARELKNKPLVEAILEIRWALKQAEPGFEHDPHYKLLLGRLYDRVTADYPAHEELPTAGLPDPMVGHTVQHRFRINDSGWPLVQLGPGVMTVNSTTDYTWRDYRPRVLSAVDRLYDAHPKLDELQVTQLILRYIDAVEFNYQDDDAYEFLRDKMKVEVALPGDLFNGTGVQQRPRVFVWQS